MSQMCDKKILHNKRDKTRSRKKVDAKKVTMKSYMF